jgi:hypothetical protein
MRPVRRDYREGTLWLLPTAGQPLLLPLLRRRGVSGRTKGVNEITGQLRVWWVRNIPGEAKFYPVATVEEAKATVKRLTLQDLADPTVHSNTYGVEEYEDGDWHEYYDSEGRNIDDLMEEQEAS